MGTNVPVVGGINSQAVRTIPSTWDAQWFRRFISDHMQKMDYRNAIAGPGITITGTEQTQGKISAGGTLLSPVIIPAPTTGSTLTVNGATGAYSTLVINSGAGSNQTSDILVSRSSSTANVVDQGPNIELLDTSGPYGTVLQNSGGQTEWWQYNGSWQQMMVGDANRNIEFVNPGYLYVESASFITANAIQSRGYNVTGFAGPAAEMGCSGGSAYYQGFNRTTAAYIPAIVVGSTVTLSPNGVARLTLGTTAGAQTAYNFGGSLTAGSYSAGGIAAPTTVAGFWAVQINGANVKIPYCNN